MTPVIEQWAQARWQPRQWCRNMRLVTFGPRQLPQIRTALSSSPSSVESVKRGSSSPAGRGNGGPAFGGDVEVAAWASVDASAACEAAGRLVVAVRDFAGRRAAITRTLRLLCALAFHRLA
jgi:hypothetical protein